MTTSEKIRFQRAFYRRAGQNIELLKAVVNTFRDTGFYITDDQDRLVAFTQRNCEECNVLTELDVIGATCAELFAPILAEVYMARDRQVRKTGVPIINQIYTHSVDRSTNIRIVSIFPIRDRKGSIIGTVCTYRSATAGESLPDWYGNLRETVAFIDQHYAERLTLEELARVANLSVTTFRRVFLETMQTTPMKYLNTIRINAARKLLISTPMKITDIAIATGFYDQSHFIKAFKAERGQTPAQYRKSHFAQ